MSNFAAPGLEQLRKSRAYKLMKEAHPYEFEPTTIYFATYEKAVESIEWNNCLPLKAAIVYHAITRKDVVDVETRGEAFNLLDAIAKKCKLPIKEAREAAKRKSGGSSDTTQQRSKSLPLGEPSQKNEPPKAAKQGNHDEDYAQALDGIFLVVGFLPVLKRNTEKGNREEADGHHLTTHREAIVKDVIKIENQLPLPLIKNIVDHVENAINNDDVKKLLKDKTTGGDYKLSFEKGEFEGIISRFCWYYSPFHCKEITKLGKGVLEMENLLRCLHFSLKKDLKKDESNGKAIGQVWRSPSARQLKRSGVRFEALRETPTIYVRFSEPKLQMPALVYDSELETVLWNLLAWECSLQEEEKPVTRYLQFMNELAGDLGDVRVMKNFGLIKGTWKNLREVLDSVKRIDGFASYPSSYVPLDEEVGEVLKYHNRRMKSFFVRNRPAVVWFSSVAAVSVIATAIYASKKRKEG